MSMIEVKTAELSGKALALATWLADRGEPGAHNPKTGYIWTDMDEHWLPHADWSQGWPLIEKYGVLLSPPKSMMHVNGGPNAGWRETGTWGSTIFGTERKHRRKAFEHQDQPLVAAMRAIVQFELGDAVSVPAELVQQQGERGGK